MIAKLDPDALLAAFDSQVRARQGDGQSPGVTVHRDGPVLRVSWADGGFVVYRDLAGIEGAELDALISRQRDFFAARGVKFEWKTYSHDHPADLPDRLRAAGFVSDDPETVLVGLAEPLADESPSLPAGVQLRLVAQRVDFERIATMSGRVWGGDQSWVADRLEQGVTHEGVDVVVAEHGEERGGPVISSAWIHYVPGTEFAGLWGGSTLPEFRKQGIYRALVAHRAALAVAKGYRYLQVDTTEDSRPILTRLGFVPITTTTPYNWRPPI